MNAECVLMKKMSIHINSQKDFTTLFKENLIAQQNVAKGNTDLHIHCNLKLHKHYNMIYWKIDENVTLHLFLVTHGKFYKKCNYIVESCQHCSFIDGKVLSVTDSRYCNFNTLSEMFPIKNCSFCIFVFHNLDFYITKAFIKDVSMCQFIFNKSILITMKSFIENAKYCSLTYCGKIHDINPVFSKSIHCDVIKD